MDKEVSDLTQREAAPIYPTAESVQKFMRSVNRIRFSSMTASNDVKTYLKNEKGFTSQGRSVSCPQLPKVTPEEFDVEDVASMSRSTSKPEMDHQEDVASEKKDQEKSDVSGRGYDVDDSRKSSVSPVKSTSSTGSNVTMCPLYKDGEVLSLQEKSESTGMMDLLRRFLMPANVSVCQKCRQQTNREASGKTGLHVCVLMICRH